MKKDKQEKSQTAIRILSNAIQMVHYFETTGEGFSPCCRNAGEYILQDAAWYLAYGDINNARKCMDHYEQWMLTGTEP